MRIQDAVAAKVSSARKEGQDPFDSGKVSAKTAGDPAIYTVGGREMPSLVVAAVGDEVVFVNVTDPFIVGSFVTT